MKLQPINCFGHQRYSFSSLCPMTCLLKWSMRGSVNNADARSKLRELKGIETVDARAMRTWIVICVTVKSLAMQT